MAKAKAAEEKDVQKSKLDITLDKLNKDFGPGTVILGNMKRCDLDVVSTGSIGLDWAVGVGGLPYGRIVEVTAPESAGKSTLCLHVIANAQNQGKRCAYIDMEHTISPSYAIALGVDMDKLLLSQPMYGEEALEIAHKLVLTGEVDVIIVDSVASLVPKSEIDGEVGDTKMGGVARVMSQGLRVLNPIVELNKCLMIFTNQIRLNIGCVSMETKISWTMLCG
jgi:recombination protein RecA